jgi:hypothetical protein
LRLEWIIKARGHPNIKAEHETTFMVTRDPEVGPKGDCVIGVAADHAAADLDPELKQALKSGKPILITLKAGGFSELVRARGDPSLPLDHQRDLVVRKSEFVCGRTVAVSADKAAVNLSRKLIETLRDPEATLEMRIEVNRI